jgi:hypothetical protein
MGKLIRKKSKRQKNKSHRRRHTKKMVSGEFIYDEENQIKSTTKNPYTPPIQEIIDDIASGNAKKSNFFGSKKRVITKKHKGIKYVRKSRKQKGGMCYGNGVGANISDPNFSIHNTNLLKLFPYKPTN